MSQLPPGQEIRDAPLKCKQLFAVFPPDTAASEGQRSWGGRQTRRDRFCFSEVALMDSPWQRDPAARVLSTAFWMLGKQSNLFFFSFVSPPTHLGQCLVPSERKGDPVGVSVVPTMACFPVGGLSPLLLDLEGCPSHSSFKASFWSGQGSAVLSPHLTSFYYYFSFSARAFLCVCVCPFLYN